MPGLCFVYAWKRLPYLALDIVVDDIKVIFWCHSGTESEWLVKCMRLCYVIDWFGFGTTFTCYCESNFCLKQMYTSIITPNHFDKNLGVLWLFIPLSEIFSDVTAYFHTDIFSTLKIDYPAPFKPVDDLPVLVETIWFLYTGSECTGHSLCCHWVNWLTFSSAQSETVSDVLPVEKHALAFF